MDNQQPQPRKTRPAFDTLREIRDGKCIDELEVAINELTERVGQTRRGGSVTLTISIAPAAKSEIAVVVNDDIKTKLPAIARPSTVMFMTEENNIQLKHPKQTDLPLLKVAENPESAKTPREVSAK